MELQIYFYENLLSLKIRLFTKILYYENLDYTVVVLAAGDTNLTTPVQIMLCFHVALY